MSKVILSVRRKAGCDLQAVYSWPADKPLPDEYEALELAEPAEPCDHVMGASGDTFVYASQTSRSVALFFEYCPECGEKLT